MPRYRRRVVPGSVQHLISRFVNRDFLLDVPHARRRYLEHAARAFARCDWRAIGYALMSSHVHWAVVAGSAPSDRLVRSLHCGFAGWLNRNTGRLGPVFAERHRNVECKDETAAGLVAYVHNNPQRAGLVGNPADSRWTSHRAYLRLEPPPSWLDIDLGMHLCGFDSTVQGRAAFHEFVMGRSGELRRTDLGADDLHERRRRARRHLQLPVQVASPLVGGGPDELERCVPIVVPTESPSRLAWRGSAEEALRFVAAHSGVDTAWLRSRSRLQGVVAARRLTILVWCEGLGRPGGEIASVLGMTSEGAVHHRRRSTSAERATAVELAAVLAAEGSQLAGLGG